MTTTQHNTKLARMEECLLIDPADLLMEDRGLLNAVFDKLIPGRTLYIIEWLAEMKTAWGTADHIAKGSHHSLCFRYFSGPRPLMRTEYEDVLIDRDGSMKWCSHSEGAT